ncbi:MAG TPA: DUF3016 domain-containing protein [Opitutaceae bacterium]|nr:DUF3016 domain-containing protein [Opitutaceae bacterium]
MTLIFAATLTALPLATKAAGANTDATQRADVTFVNPDKFTDARDSYQGTDAGRDANLAQIREYMLKEANRYIPDGDRLSISVTDVDLAGDFEPWRGGQWDHVRIMKDIYPPRLALTFRLTDSSGNVIKEGTRRLQNLTYLQELVPQFFRDDPLKYDKALIDGWYGDEFGGLKKR